MRAKAPLAESAGKLIKLLDELIIDLNQPLLDLPQKNITELDKKLYALRDDEMVRISCCCCVTTPTKYLILGRWK